MRSDKTTAKKKAADNLPRHIAIIMDGNGRWAQKRLMPRTLGHRAGMSALKNTVITCAKLGIQVLTVFAFSTENWRRPREEVNYLMNLLIEFLNRELQELHENNIKTNILGDYSSLPGRCAAELEKALNTTRHNNGMVFNIALNYGARDEILKAVRELAGRVVSGTIKPEEITAENLSELLYTKGLPDPDLLIRTAGEMRISNFLLWQIAYTELWITDKLWPDFSKEDLMAAINDFQQRDRRFGGLSKNSQDEPYAKN